MTYDSSATHDAPLKVRRSPSTPVEAWACRALVLIAGLDPDGARVRNGEGFSSADTEFGCSLAAAIMKYGPRMTEKQWPLVVRLATRYRGQVEATDPMPATSSAAANATTRTEAPASVDPPEIAALKAQLAAGEYMLDAILATPTGETCGADRARSLARYRWPGNGGREADAHADLITRAAQAVGERCLSDFFGLCGKCPLGPKGAHRADSNRVCRGLTFIAEKTVLLKRSIGADADASEIEADMGIVSEKKTPA